MLNVLNPTSSVNNIATIQVGKESFSLNLISKGQEVTFPPIIIISIKFLLLVREAKSWNNLGFLEPNLLQLFLAFYLWRYSWCLVKSSMSEFKHLNSTHSTSVKYLLSPPFLIALVLDFVNLILFSKIPQVLILIPQLKIFS